MGRLNTSKVRKRIVARVYRPGKRGCEELEQQLWRTGHLETVINAVHASIVESLHASIADLGTFFEPLLVDRHDYIWEVING